MSSLTYLSPDHVKYMISLVSQFPCIWNSNIAGDGRPAVVRAWNKIKKDFDTRFLCTVDETGLQSCWETLQTKYRKWTRSPQKMFGYSEELSFLSSNIKAIPLSDLNEELRHDVLTSNIVSSEATWIWPESYTKEVLMRVSLRLRHMLHDLDDIRNKDDFNRRIGITRYTCAAKKARSVSIYGWNL
ncbi:unnamed protein product [Caenorhabditis auriculariae]|uniref:MADF domain-containing protein n=1 Tax=Caenorhabditis auriculariae TaxID=2777116 RepID=A0A8S1H1G6_9PELO|nr:unnamed protein product [Caenorhabditis auriculariae]